MTDKWQLAKKKKIPVTTLDSILFGKRQAEPFWGEFIKIDTQGSEYDILTGAKRTLQERTVAVMCEVAFCEIYKGQKLFSDIEQLMRARGFSFYGFTQLHGRSCKLLGKEKYVTAERLLYSDAIFFKDPLPDATLSDRQTYALFTIALLFNFYDFALELASKTWLKNTPDKSSLIQFVQDLASLPPSKTLRDIEDLLAQAKATPELANMYAGNFVDRRRRICDYDDVLNTSLAAKQPKES